MKWWVVEMNSTDKKPPAINLGGIRIEQLDKALALIPADTEDKDLIDLRDLFKRGIRDYRIGELTRNSLHGHPRWRTMSSEERFSLALRTRRIMTHDYDVNESGGWVR
jgi:hypothetical protein